MKRCPMRPAAAAGGEVDLRTTSATDAPQFLGPLRTAVYPEVKLAADWSAEKPKLLWRQPIGAGWSSFAVVGKYGVTQEQRGEEELVTCYDLDNGKLQWAQSTPVRFHETLAGIGPRATPTIDDGQVYALGATGLLHCLDGATGKPIWQHDIVSETGATPPQWGKSCSPLVHDGLVIVSAGAPGGKSLVAYDKTRRQACVERRRRRVQLFVARADDAVWCAADRDRQRHEDERPRSGDRQDSLGTRVA